MFFMNIGLPGSGKSTFIQKLRTFVPNLVEASTDKSFELYAVQNGISYSEAFNQLPFNQAKSIMNKEITEAIKNNHNIVLDQTNVSRTSRQAKLQQIPCNYVKIAILFDVPLKVISERLLLREQQTGKHIPEHVLRSMQKSFQYPTLSEGFDELFVYTL